MFEFITSRYPHPLHAFGEQVLTDSFPAEERPAIVDLRARENPSFHFDIILEEKTPIGILTHWDFPSFTYIEHFAIVAEMRNKQLGGKVLDQFIPTRPCVVLEAEYPQNELARRRLNFYQRHGFILTSYPYTQPAYSPELESVPLHILTTQAFNAEQFEAIKNTLYTEVYKVL